MCLGEAGPRTKKEVLYTGVSVMGKGRVKDVKVGNIPFPLYVRVRVEWAQLDK